MQTQAKEKENSQKIKLSKIVKSFYRKTLEERTAEYDGKLMLDGEYDWHDPLGREIW